jgi:hypothetical protein
MLPRPFQASALASPGSAAVSSPSAPPGPVIPEQWRTPEQRVVRRIGRCEDKS